MTEPKKRHLLRLGETEEAIPFTPHKQIVCPFCKKLFYMGKEQDGTPAVTHEMPPCKEFLDLNLESFLRKVRMIYSP